MTLLIKCAVLAVFPRMNGISKILKEKTKGMRKIQENLCPPRDNERKWRVKAGHLVLMYAKPVLT